MTPEEKAKEAETKKNKDFGAYIIEASTSLKKEEASLRAIARDLRGADLKYVDGHLTALGDEATELRDMWMKLESLFEQGASKTDTMKFLDDCLPRIKAAHVDGESAQLRIDPSYAKQKAKKKPVLSAISDEIVKKRAKEFC